MKRIIYISTKLKYIMLPLVSKREEIYKVIKELFSKINARAVLAIDRNGNSIAEIGILDEKDVGKIAQLCAASVADSENLALFLGGGSYYRITHEGDEMSLHLYCINNLVLIIFADPKTNFGLLRMSATEAAEELKRLLG